MNAPANLPAANMAIWNALSRTDPKHTKQFSRSGGFKGTALKPIWIVQRLTEQFGPVGTGWGMNEPQFQVVPAGDEVMVYCTVGCWIAKQPGDESYPAVFYGVGGDKVLGKNKYGLQSDDEAFKKAFTDAVGNAFKFLGVGADIHMGQFDDSKYVQEVAREFAGGQSQGVGQGADSPRQTKPKAHSALKTAYRQFIHEANGCGDGDELSAFLATADSVKLVAEIREKLPHIWDGENWPENQERPEMWEPLSDFITRRQRECAEASAQYLTA